MQYTPVAKLSGGERRRLQLLKVLVTNPNFLILDEPTNDLDIDTLNVLEDFLYNFDGCLMLVSHDRYFMDKLVDHLFVFEGNGKIADHYGNYTDYRESKAYQPESPKEKAAMTPSAPVASAPVPDKPKRKLSFKEQKELSDLETELENLESKKTELNNLLNAGSTDHEALNKWATEIAEIDAKIDHKTMRWLELSEL